MNSKNKERLRPTGMRQECLVSSQALSGFFMWSKSLTLKEVVGASGFEPTGLLVPNYEYQFHKRFLSRRLRDEKHYFPSLSCT
jgi:hypothetical protein